MNVDIDFKDEKLNEIIKTIKNNYEQFNFCSISVKRSDSADFETEDYVHDIKYEPEVTIKLVFHY